MRKVYLDKLPKKGRGVDWGSSIGQSCDFVYDDICGRFVILEYSNPKIKIEYNQKVFCTYIATILKGNISDILGLRIKPHIYKIGDVINGVEIVEYISCMGNGKEYMVKCVKDGHVFKTTERAMKTKKHGDTSGCPVCHTKATVKGTNDIATTSVWMTKFIKKEEDWYKYRNQSNTRVLCKCPDCGKEKMVLISNLYKTKSIGCSCGDGTSYPNKFIFNLLGQLCLNFQTEYSPVWANRKKYDFLINKNIIIEAHGEQHYEGGFERMGNGRDLEEEKSNDKLKRELALESNINHYVELDCRKSEMEWIKQSVMNSDLPNLLNFKASDINWIECGEFATKNLAKEACILWSSDKFNSTTELGRHMGLAGDTVRKYLKAGCILGWCVYDPKQQTRESGSRSGKLSGKKVEIFKDGESLGVFASCCELARVSETIFMVKLNSCNIGSVCIGRRKSHKGFVFRYV